jgi:HK97 gp10 family phage protein
MPSSGVTVSVEGLSDLEDALTELPKATAKNCIRRALTAACQPIVDEATQLIRVRRVKPSIAVSKIKFTSGNAGKQAFAEAMARGATREEAGEAAHQANAADTSEGSDITSGVAVVGPTRAAFYGFEFGTIHQAPKPFMRPAWDNHKMEALGLIQTELKAQIEAAAIRIARKQLRLLAKMQSK